MSWVNGRQLASASDGTNTYSYIYDAAGSRIMKNVGTVNHLYFYVNGMLLMEYRYNAMGDTTDVLQYFYDANGNPHAMSYNGTVYLYVTNLQGDIVALLGLDGTVSGYEYDPYGNVIASYGDIAAINPLRYRGYYYDTETGLYYVSSRYYDPEIGRFINADDADLLAANGDFASYNLFAYCSNNPVCRKDSCGYFWESALDVVSLGASIIEVAINPTDVWAWAGLVGDAVDLVPFVTGVGEITRALKTVNKTDDVVDAAKALRATNSVARDARSAYGSYEILYSSGKNYIGKGSFDRAIASATRNAGYDKITGIAADPVVSIRWKSAPSTREAFIDEYLMQKRFGGVLRSNEELLTYNKIWSPGRRYYGH